MANALWLEFDGLFGPFHLSDGLDPSCMQTSDGLGKNSFRWAPACRRVTKPRKNNSMHANHKTVPGKTVRAESS